MEAEITNPKIRATGITLTAGWRNQPRCGTIAIVFHDCNSANLSYEIPDADVSGDIELSRVSPDNIAL